jgi:hypothetical protein
MTTLSITTLSIMTIIIITLSITLSRTINKTQPPAQWQDCCYAECRSCSVSFMLSDTNKPFMLNIVMLNDLAKPGAIFKKLHFLHKLQMGPMHKRHYTRLERLDRDKHSSLLGPFVSYDEILNTAPGTVFKTLHKLQMGPICRTVTLHKVERLAKDKHSSLLSPFVSY